MCGVKTPRVASELEHGSSAQRNDGCLDCGAQQLHHSTRGLAGAFSAALPAKGRLGADN